MLNPKLIIVIGTFLLALAVAAGAFGAHALKNILSPERIETWHTAVQYHTWHAMGLILISLISYQFHIDLQIPALLLLAGIIIFSGSLYILCLTGITWLGAITPLGGLAFIAGWIYLGFKVMIKVT